VGMRSENEKEKERKEEGGECLVVGGLISKK
jgi:hypothetical protein